MENYLAYHFDVSPQQPGSDLLMADLGEMGFDSFEETENGCIAYIKEEQVNQIDLESCFVMTSTLFDVSYEIKKVAATNWNETWESNFQPLEIDGQIQVRAPFHESAQLTHEIVIEPKMSFGTGHHETTHMMLSHMLALDFKNKDVLDMGCGTGILAIFAKMKGAAKVKAIDIDAWCFENTNENVVLNKVSSIEVEKGDVSLLGNTHFDVILANINRNILLNDMATYVSVLKQGGHLFLSGFYKEDIALIEKEAVGLGLVREHIKDKNNWVALRYTKK